MANILIIDDDGGIREVLAYYVERLGHFPISASTLAGGLRVIASQPFDVVFLDVNLPDGDGISAIPLMHHCSQSPDIIIITGQGALAGAELAIKSGAWDYIQKPFTEQEIILQLTRVLDYRNLRQADAAPMLTTLKRADIIGMSPQLNAQLDIAAQCARTDANILISGETGTGKELFAKMIHDNGLHPGGPFVVVDCAALPEQLVESVLFGHVKGAFTGADRDRDGLALQADRGTLFLDEVGELPLPVQKKFLRVLQERRFKPVGGTREIKSAFRLIAATNQDLDQLVECGGFRRDLLFRLRTFSIHLPPLRGRVEDISALTLYYIHKICRHHGVENKGFVPEFIEMLSLHAWPGNIRELVSTLEKAILAAGHTPTLYPLHLPSGVRVAHAASVVAAKKKSAVKDVLSPDGDFQPMTVSMNLVSPLPPLKTIREELVSQFEHQYLSRLIKDAAYNLDKAAAISGLSKPRLYALLKRHAISLTSP